MPKTTEQLAKDFRKLSPEKQRFILQKLKKKKSEIISAVKIISRPDDIPLSFAQQRLWFLDQLEGPNAAYTIPVALKIIGKLNVPVLEQSLNKIIQRHESLRTVFDTKNGMPVQLISLELILMIKILDIQSMPDTERNTEMNRLIDEEDLKPFDLSNGPLIRAKLLKLESEEHVFLLTIHHIIYDGWSIGIMLNELSTFYQAYLKEEDYSFQELPIQYADYAIQQHEHFEGDFLQKQSAYWKNQLADIPAVLGIPTDKPHPTERTYQGSRVSFTLSLELSQKLKDLSKREGVTLFMMLLTAFAILLSRYSSQRDVLIGSPIAARNRSELESLIGLFINTLVLRIDLSVNQSFQGLLRQVKRTVLDAYAHQDIPFEKLVEALEPERDMSRTPLYQVGFTLQNIPVSNFDIPGLSFVPLETDKLTAKFDLNLIMSETESGLGGILEYNTDIFHAETIQRMSIHLQNLLNNVIQYPEQLIFSISFLSRAEEDKLLFDWNDTKKNYSDTGFIHQLFELKAEQIPSAVAVIFNDLEITYKDLNFRSNQLAHYMKLRTVGSESVVGVYMERSIELVVSLLAILKCGGVYVPLDPDYPDERTSFMVEDSDVELVLVQEKYMNDFDNKEIDLICVDRDLHLISQENRHNLSVDFQPDNLAYIIYTSGSTGRPKGAMNTHRGMYNRLLWMQDFCRLNENDRVLQKTPFSFDVSVWEFFLPLMTGATLVVAEPEGHKDSSYLVNLIFEKEINIIHFVPSMLRAFLENREIRKCSSLKQVICSGEALPFDLQKRFFDCLNAELYNLYGPTEAAVDVTYHHCVKNTKHGIVPIGRPIHNTSIYILDEYFYPIPIGALGELYIGGLNVARGYYNRADLTAEKFIPDPFSDEKGARLYKTGDLVRFLPDGEIEYIGRIDSQVKIRGFRIELGEIEAILCQHESIREVVVMACEDHPGNRQLVAYYTGNDTVTDDELRNYLKTNLPDYMIPQFFHELEKMPLTTNGKIDRKRLPKPDGSYSRVEYVEPCSETEKSLADIWVGVLKLDRVGTNDNFFQIGGHSLLAIQVMSRIHEQFQLKLPVRTLFDEPTIDGLAGQIEKLSKAVKSASIELDEDREEGEI
ncbi:MAG: amino acid adenylation domain-containing protein [Candidatus Scalindua sp.]|jgi:amino acid adenylation domain-containing protein|nr:amino acid adenylation domain-containing protein [Candidatus Scalindua sp.]MBT6225658.1 amino acid adenylation domain-containing protein [Candidatus Scalindua sp.]